MILPDGKVRGKKSAWIARLDAYIYPPAEVL